MSQIEENLISEISSNQILDFSCGDEGIDNYFHKKSLSDYKNGTTVTHVFKFVGDSKICGMYSLKSSALLISETTKLSAIPAFEIYMFAIDLAYQGKRVNMPEEELHLSDFLLFDALGKCEDVAENTVAAQYIIANSKRTRRAESLYIRNGFEDISPYLKYIPIPEDSKGIMDCRVLVRRFN